jgi:hypothetical protein
MTDPKTIRTEVKADEMHCQAELIPQAANIRTTGGHTNDLSASRDLVAELARSGASAAIAKTGDTVIDWHVQRLKPGECKIKKLVTKIRKHVLFQ